MWRATSLHSRESRDLRSSFSAFLDQLVDGDFPASRSTRARMAGDAGYESAGFTVGRHFGDQIPSNAEHDEWAAELDKLEAFIEDDEALRRWLLQTYPVILAKVPARRMGRFLTGIRRAHGEGLTGC